MNDKKPSHSAEPNKHPWFLDITKMEVLDANGKSLDFESVMRAIECSNALAGIRNPAGVKELIEAARNILKGIDAGTISGGLYLYGALAALDQEPKS